MDILYITGFRSRRSDIEEPAAPAPNDRAHDDGADHSPDPRVPLMPLFLSANSTPTIPHQLCHLQRSKFPHCCADALNESSKKGSNVYG